MPPVVAVQMGHELKAHAPAHALTLFAGLEGRRGTAACYANAIEAWTQLTKVRGPERVTWQTASDAITRLLADMHAAGVELSADTYVSYACALLSAGQSTEAFALLDDVLAAGHHQLDAPAFTRLLGACSSSAEANDVNGVLQRMEAAGVPPNEFTLGALVKSRLATPSATSADVLALARSTGVRLNTVLFNMIIDASLRAGDIAGAVHQLHEMKKEGVAPDAVTLRLLVNGATRQACPSMATQFLMYVSPRVCTRACTTPRVPSHACAC
ncbi:hypothetical protein EON67_10165 [archaeon]|nr:MAG: hypothetical protein EON67_10165 [archaeon]